jgi:hypothetical protein
MSISIEQHALYLKLSNYTTPEKMEAFVEAFLETGGDPDIYIRNPNAFQSVLGMCCHRAATGAVHRLLAAGASVHWPRKSLTQKTLTGSAEEQYEGLNVDALGITLEMLGGYLVEHAERDRGKHVPLSEKVGGFLEITRALLLAGADPTRPDPAHGRKPLDGLMVQLMEETSSPLDKEIHAALDEVVFMLAHHSNCLNEAARGKWRDSPVSDFDWAEEYPEVVRSVRARAQQEMLHIQTPSKPGSRKSRL